MQIGIRTSSYAAVLAALVPAALAGEARTAELEPRAYRTWEIWLPAERLAEVGSGFVVPGAGVPRYPVRIEGQRLRADLDGNGELEALVEGSSGFLTLTGTSPEGRPFAYSVRLLQRPGQPWQYTCGGAMVGEIAGVKVQLIDQNLNGSFADYGEDALVVGSDAAASFLSRVVSIEGELYGIDVARDGSRLTYQPYDGPAGVLDLCSGFEGKAKVAAAVVVAGEGELSFSLARAKQGLRVPAGEYRLHSGSLVLGDARASVKTGRARPFAVGSGERRVVAWGGPVTAEFAYQRRGDELAFTPWDIWYYGRLGEEYSGFLPLGRSPDFVVRENPGGEPLVIARFPGNC
jgi:hypothetical protein